MSQNKTALEYQSFNPQARGFSAENALFLAKNARLSYEEISVMQYVCKELWSLPDFKYIEHSSDEDDVQAYIAASQDRMIVTFRGTEANNMQDWVNNMDTQLTDRFRGSVHKGFMRSVDFIWNDLSDAIKEFHQPNQKIFFCGHSQGGALATLAAARALEEGIDLHQVYTFGQPRVGNLLFASLFNQKFQTRLFRIVNHGDIITRAPTRKSEYSHCGTFLFLDNAGLLHTDSIYWKNFWDDLGVSIWDLLDIAIADVEEHKTSAYIQKLAALVD